jgi:hypothetical protein
MTFHMQKHGWLTGLGVAITLLWSSQFAAGWFAPHNDIEFAQHSKIELANTIESERCGFSRASRLDSKPDPTGLQPDLAELNLPWCRNHQSLFNVAAEYSKQLTGLPAIRAPPSYILSA